MVGCGVFIRRAPPEMLPASTMAMKARSKERSSKAVIRILNNENQNNMATRKSSLAVRWRRNENKDVVHHWNVPWFRDHHREGRTGRRRFRDRHRPKGFRRDSRARGIRWLAGARSRRY